MTDTPEIARIREALAELKPDVRKPWVKLDKLPYIHATDDPEAKPYSSPVVGRFDYMESADYILACNPDAITAVLAHIDAQAAEIERLRADYNGACKLVADMHAAAMGKVTGPVLGVVEDVAALRVDAARYLYICKQDFKDRQWFGSFDDYKRQRDACIDVSMRAAAEIGKAMK